MATFAIHAARHDCRKDPYGNVRPKEAKWRDQPEQIAVEEYHKGKCQLCSPSSVQSAHAVDKREAPSFATRLNEQWVRFGTNITLRAQLNGNPTPRCTWFRNTKILQAHFTLHMHAALTAMLAE